MPADRTTPLILGCTLAAGLAGWLLPAWAVQIGIVALARGVVVLGLVVLIRAGLVSFGQALYFALGGYAVGLLAARLGVTDAFLRLFAGALAAAVVGALAGALLRRYRGIFFAMLSLAFSMIFYGLLVKSETLGSTDGFSVAATTYLTVRPPAGAERHWLFVFALLVAALAALTVHRYWRSTRGRLAQALRDNEVRLEYLGVSAERLVHGKVVLAAALGGAGGALSAMAVGHVDPAMAFWTTSGELVFVAILSGSGSVVAPFAGAFAFEALHSFAMHAAPQAWRLLFGGALLAVILFAPGGLWSLVQRRRPA